MKNILFLFLFLFFIFLLLFLFFFYTFLLTPDQEHEKNFQDIIVAGFSDVKNSKYCLIRTRLPNCMLYMFDWVLNTPVVLIGNISVQNSSFGLDVFAFGQLKRLFFRRSLRGVSNKTSVCKNYRTINT